MKKHIYMISTALVIGVAAPVAAQDNFAAFSEGILGMLSANGATVSFDARNVGDDGSVELVGFWMSAPDGSGTVRADWIKGVPSATTPGQVTFTLSPSATFSFTDPKTGEHVINISNSGLSITLDGITSGQGAETLNFSLIANSLGFTSGNPDDTILKALDIAFTNLSQTVAFSPASNLLRGETSLAALSTIYDITPPDGTQIASNGQMADLGMSFQVIADDNKRNIIDYLSGITTAFFNISVGASSDSGKMVSPDGRIAYTGTSEGANLEIRAENGYLKLQEGISAAQYSFSEFNVGGMPLPPFDVALESMLIKLTTPTVDHGSPEEANAVIALRGLEVSESIYSMVDPKQVLTRSPINAVVDISATVTPKIDWSNPETAMRGNPANIADVQDITINEVLFTAGGAKITADGSAVVDNSMGFPLPTGKVTITAAGVQALVNGLVSMGLIPQDQAGLAMGMMLTFARPGDAPDVFISDIEFSQQGITANGVPLPM